jgi:hypothetical protein
MLRSWLAIASFFAFVTPALADIEMERPNTVSLELLGRGLLYSLDYDRQITKEIAVGGGLSAWSVGATTDNGTTYAAASVVIVPLYLDYYLYSRNGNRWYVTGGVDFVSARFDGGGWKFSNSGLALTGGGGYEYRADNGFLFRGALYLLVGGGDVHIWPGLSAGFTF